MTGFASAQAAFEAPPGDGPDLIDCPACEGNSELVRCPLNCDGSHVQDQPYPCDTCKGEGQIDPRDSADWCDRCGLTGACPDCDPREQDDDR